MMNSMLFEGPSLEDVLSEARLCFGADVEIEAANRVRRGGLLGFFATEWYEVWARPSAAVAENPALALVDAEDDPDSFQSMMRNAMLDRHPDEVVAPEREYESAMDRFFDDDAVRGDGGSAPRREPVPVGASAATATLTAPPPAASVPAPTPTPAPAPVVADLASESVPAAVALEDPPRGTSVFAPARTPRTDLLWAMLDRLDGLPAAPELPTSGIVVFVGDAAAAHDCARAMGARTGAWRGDVSVVSRREEVDGVPDWLVVNSDEEFADAVTRWRRSDRLVPVILDQGLDAGDRRWAGMVLAELGAAQLRVVAEAWRLPDDVGRFASDLGGADAIELGDVTDAVEPLAMVDLGIPVASVEGRTATPELLAAVWLENRRRV